MKLLHRSKLIGEISNVEVSDMWFVGEIHLLPAAEPFKPLFDFLIDEERNDQEPPFSEEVLEGWSIEDADGVTHSIFAPAIDNNYTTIEWRW